MQQPLPSGFGARITAREVLGDRRLDGMTAIVTGGYAGIGLETTRVLASAGAHVIVPARDLAKATAALAGVANVAIDRLDLGDPDTIDAFVAGFGDRPLHLLINNAGIMSATSGCSRIWSRRCSARRALAWSRCRRAVTCGRPSTSRTPTSSAGRTTR